VPAPRMVGIAESEAQAAQRRTVDPETAGSSPATHPMAGYSSGQRGLTVNQLAPPAKVRILHLPPPLLVADLLTCVSAG
jgi:hypothetical protein